MPKIEDIEKKGKKHYPDRNFFDTPTTREKRRELNHVDASIFGGLITNNSSCSQPAIENAGVQETREDSTGNMVQKVAHNVVQNQVQNMVQISVQEVNSEGAPDLRSQQGDFKLISGTQKEILRFFCGEAAKSEAREAGGFLTAPVTNKEISSLFPGGINTARTAIKRLVKKEILVRWKWVCGRAGYTIYFIPESVYHYFRQNSLSKEQETEEEKAIGSLKYHPATLPKVWENIKIGPLEKHGLMKSHIIQLWRQYQKTPELALSSDTIQDSIDAMAFDLKHNDVDKGFRKSPVFILVSILKKGEPYISVTPDKYKTPRQEKMDEYLLAIERQSIKQKETEYKIKENVFKEWLDSLSEEELLGLCPPAEIPEGTPKKVQKTMRHRKAVEMSKSYFEIEIWPAKKAELQKQFEGEAEHA